MTGPRHSPRHQRRRGGIQAEVPERDRLVRRRHGLCRGRNWPPPPSELVASQPREGRGKEGGTRGVDGTRATGAAPSSIVAARASVAPRGGLGRSPAPPLPSSERERPASRALPLWRPLRGGRGGSRRPAGGRGGARGAAGRGEGASVVPPSHEVGTMRRSPGAAVAPRNGSVATGRGPGGVATALADEPGPEMT